MRTHFTEQQLRNVVETSYSINEAVKKLYNKSHGGGCAMVKKYIKILNIDTSHFDIMIRYKDRWNNADSDKYNRNRIKTEDYLSNKCFTPSCRLKIRLVKEGILEDKCFNCHLIDWMGAKITLQLHHKDGNPENNNLDNLCILCPNCHTQTENYGSKNSKKFKEKKMCPICNGVKQKRSTLCEKCFWSTRRGRFVKKDWPETQDLINEIKETSRAAVARRLGVSPSAVFYRIKNFPTMIN